MIQVVTVGGIETHYICLYKHLSTTHFVRALDGRGTEQAMTRAATRIRITHEGYRHIARRAESRRPARTIQHPHMKRTAVDCRFYE